MATERLNLTARVIERLKPRDVPYRVWDVRVHELFLRVQPSGVKSWNVVVGRSSLALGKPPHVSPDMARNAAREALGHAAKGQVPPKLAARRGRAQARLEGRPETLDALLDRYELGPHRKLRDPAAVVARIRCAYKALLPLPVEKITEARTAAIHAERLRKVDAADKAPGRRTKQRSPATIARDFSGLYGAFTWGVRHEYVARHPFQEMKPEARAGREIVRYLAPQERARLFEALATRDRQMREARERTLAGGRTQHADLAPIPEDGFADYLEPLVRLALNCGARRGELLALRWESVDLTAGHFIVEKTGAKGSNKANKQRVVILNREALAVLTRWKKQTGGTGRVFPVGNITKAWTSLLKRAQIETFRFHDLRHDAASQLVMNGADLYSVSKVLGHANVNTTTRYAHLSRDHLRATLGVLDTINGSPGAPAAPSAPSAPSASNVIPMPRKHAT